MSILQETGFILLSEAGLPLILDIAEGITPPDQIAYHQPATAYNTDLFAATTLDQAGVSLVAGDLITFIGSAEKGTIATALTPSASGGSITWTSRGSVGSGNDSQSPMYMHSGVVGATATVTLTGTRTSGGANGFWGWSATVWRNHGGVGNTAITNELTTPQLAVTCLDNSALTGQINDWNAVSGATRDWLEINSNTIEESTYYHNSAVHTVYAGRSPDVGAAGSKTWGLSAPSGQLASIGVIEVKGL